MSRRLRNLISMETCIKKFKDINIQDIEEVGYKNASIGKLINHFRSKGVLIPDGFAITASAYRYFITYNNLDLQLKLTMDCLDKEEFSNLELIGKRARDLILGSQMPADLGMAIIDAYDYLFDLTSVAIAVRSSIVTCKLADAVVAVKNDSFLNVKGHLTMLYAVKQCYASLYNDEAIRHAINHGDDLTKCAMSVGIQEMVRADMSCSGVAFTHDPQTGANDVIYIKGIWGLGEVINHETVIPDEYSVFKPSTKMISLLLIEKELGNKGKMMVYADEDVNQTVFKDTPLLLQEQFTLNDDEIRQLANWALLIEDLYKVPMDFEWAKDGKNHQLYLMQVAPFVTGRVPVTVA
jgi:pyruvate,water dikinase